MTQAKFSFWSQDCDTQGFTSGLTAVLPRGSLGALMLGSTMLMTPASLRAQDVAMDGRTATSLATGGGITDVTTATIHNGLGINSFTTLNVASGATVNIHAPTGTTGTVNLVRDNASIISGTLNGMMNGTVGGSMVLANPNGIVVGAGGQINAGALSLSTPDAAFMNGVFGADGQIVQGHLDAIRDGTAPRAADADIIIDGQITAPDGITIRAGRDVVVGATGAVGRAQAVSGVANIGPRRAIVLDGGRDTRISGQIVSRDASGAGGAVQARAGESLDVIGTIDVSGAADGAGGTISLHAEEATWISPTGAVFARGAGLGAGGHITIHAPDDLSLQGRITAAASASGVTAGEVVVSGENITLRDNLLVEGSNLILQAAQEITIGLEKAVSTRATVDPLTGRFSFSPTNGNSGNLTLQAAVITVGEGALLLANDGTGADGTVFSGGALKLEARSVVGQPGLFTVRSAARISLGRGAQLLADSVEISAVAESRLAATSLQDLIDLGTLGLPQPVADLAGIVVDSVITDLIPDDISVLPARVRAVASIVSEAADIRAAQGDVVIRAHAETDVDIGTSPEARLAIVGVQTETTAEVELYSSQIFFPQAGYVQGTQQITANGDIRISATTQEVQNLSASAGGDSLAPALVLSDRTSKAQVRWAAAR